MKKTESLYHKLKQNRLIALLTPKSADECLQAYELFEREGIVLELAFRSDHALNGLKLIFQKFPEALVLAGTVMTAAQAKEAVSAGAAGIVSADFIPEVVDVCAGQDVMCIPGGLADAGKQLVHKAACYGCSLEELRERYPYQWIYKLFPAVAGEVNNARMAGAWRGPYQGLTVVYTGGITLENISGIARMDPEGIFCASALAKHVEDVDLVKAEISRWKAALKPTVPKADISLPEETQDRAKGIRVVTFGELMARLSPPPGVRLQNAAALDLRFGGAEANVAVSLARFGLNSCFVSALPENDLGDNACGVLRAFGVDTGRIARKGERLGAYYLEHGAGPRPSKVVYDRAHSAFSQIAPGDFDWESILDGATWFHWTGITPALGDNVADACVTPSGRPGPEVSLSVPT